MHAADSTLRLLVSALDHDDFPAVRALLSPDCTYEFRGRTLEGPDAIVSSYEEASRRARETFDEVQYLSTVTETATGGRVEFVDVLRHRGFEHRHRCVQHVTIGPDARVTRIVHEDLAGESDALAAFIARVGVRWK